MTELLRSIAENSNLPVLTAFILGILTSVSPCTFTTNVMVLGFIGKEITNKRTSFLNGLLYTGGRIVSYTILGIICLPLLKEGASTYFVQKIISQYGNAILAPILILFGLFLLLGDKLPIPKFGFKATDKSKRHTGGGGAFILGLLFAFAFCPISGVFYFGMLLPLAALEPAGYLFPGVFAVASGVLVVILAWIVSFGISGLSRFYNRVNLFQKWLNKVVAVVFILMGGYYFWMYF